MQGSWRGKKCNHTVWLTPVVPRQCAVRSCPTEAIFGLHSLGRAWRKGSSELDRAWKRPSALSIRNIWTFWGLRRTQRKFAIQPIRTRNRVAQSTFPSLRHLFFFFRVGLPFRLVLAILRSSALLIDSYMPLDAPLREDFLPFPLLAANAAPAAICCFFDFAGIQFSSCCFRLLLLSPFRL